MPSRERTAYPLIVAEPDFEAESRFWQRSGRALNEAGERCFDRSNRTLSFVVKNVLIVPPSRRTFEISLFSLPA